MKKKLTLKKRLLVATMVILTIPATIATVNQTPVIDESKLYPITNVVDGDTAKINIEGDIYTLRIIGLNTPETVDPRTGIECYGKEASNRAKELLTNQSVKLEIDLTQTIRDKYNRLLVYVKLPNGDNFSEVMIKEGYAFEYTFSKPYKYQPEFRKAQEQAKNDQIGLWNKNTCNGELKLLNK